MSQHVVLQEEILLVHDTNQESFGTQACCSVLQRIGKEGGSVAVRVLSHDVVETQ